MDYILSATPTLPKSLRPAAVEQWPCKPKLPGKDTATEHRCRSLTAKELLGMRWIRNERTFLHAWVRENRNDMNLFLKNEVRQMVVMKLDLVSCKKRHEHKFHPKLRLNFIKFSTIFRKINRLNFLSCYALGNKCSKDFLVTGVVPSEVRLLYLKYVSLYIMWP